MSKRKYGFINGTIKHPARGSLWFEDWRTMHSLTVSWIFATIDPALILQLPYNDEAKVL